MKKQISQSLLKDVMEYEAGELCGNVLQAKLDGVYPDDTGSEPGKPSAAKQGQYFEYITWGNLPAYGDGSIPQPEYTSAGMKKAERDRTIDDMYAPYYYCHIKSDRLKEYMKAMKMKIVSRGQSFENEWGRGTVDLIVECKALGPGLWILDNKYTALLDASWSKSKYAWNFNNIDLRELQGVQPKQYKWLTGHNFAYLLVSSAPKNNDMRIVKANVSDEAMLKFRDEALAVRDHKLPLYEATGFEPRPSLVKCDTCPLQLTCKDRAKRIDIVEMDFN